MPTLSATACDGAILIRPVVVETCATLESPVCDEAGNAEGDPGRFRFVEDPESLWGIEQHRPWSSPGGLVLSPDGQLHGARTVSVARTGNLVLTLAFAAFLQRSDDLPREQVDRLEAIADSLGMAFDHPELVLVPALGIAASNSEPLAGETVYVLHFDEPDGADLIWRGPASQGPIEATVALAPGQIARLAAGDPVRFTAVRESATDGDRSVYSVPFTPINQAGATRTLLGYMARQLSQDLAALTSSADPGA